MTIRERSAHKTSWSKPVPIINVTLIEGYSDEARLRLSQRLTSATLSVIKAPAELVTVVVGEVAPTNYVRGAIHRKPGPSEPMAGELVKSYLEAMEKRDLGAATAYLSTDFTMTFPGGISFNRLQQLVDWSKTRYRSIAKTYENFDESYSVNGTIVYCFGTLHGEWLDGSAFSSIRFIDRFDITDGQIQSQQVWNDLAESRG